MYHQLRSFLAIAELKSVSLAARRIHLTQPALTQHVRFLEGRFRAKLLRREGNGMELTPEGRVLHDAAKPLVEGMDHLGEAFHAEPSEQEIVRFAVIDSVTESILPAAVRSFLGENPRAQLIPSVEASGLAIQDLLKGVIDMALITLDELPNGLGGEELFQERMAFIGAPAHRGLRRERLARLPFIIFPKSSRSRRAVDEALARLGIVPNILLETIKVSAIVALVEAGMGVSLVPYYSVHRDLASGRIVELSLQTSIRRRVGIAYRKDRPLSPPAIRFIRCLRAERPGEER